MRSRHPAARNAALAMAALVATSACSGASEAPTAALIPSETVADAPPTDADAPGGQGATDDAPDDTASATSTDAPSQTDAPSAPASSPSPAPASSAPPASNPPTSPDGSGTLHPVPAGTWAYATDGWSQLGENPRRDLPSRTTLEVTAAGSDDIQHQTRDTRDDDGYGSRNTTTLRYGVEGVVLLSTVLESTVDVFGSPFTQQTNLEAKPPVVIAPNGVDVGDRASLHLVGDEVEVDGAMTVVARETVTVAGKAVDTLKVEVQYTLTGEIEGTSNATWWVRPSDLLIVREISSTDVMSRGLRYREEYESTLTRMSPA